MADVILLILGVVGSLVIIVAVIVVAYQARGSRPVVMMLSKFNMEKSALTVGLGPYVEIVSRHFPETLDT